MTISPSESEFVIRPNTAHHRTSWLWPYTLLVVICLGIALRFAWLGYWMILPFALLDMLAVGLVFKLLLDRSDYLEKLRIDERHLQIDHIQKNRNRQWRFPLHWVQVQLTTPDHRWYPRRLQLGYRGEWVEIGQCLTDDERTSLAESLVSEIKRWQMPERTEHA